MKKMRPTVVAAAAAAATAEHGDGDAQTLLRRRVPRTSLAAVWPCRLPDSARRTDGSSRAVSRGCQGRRMSADVALPTGGREDRRCRRRRQDSWRRLLEYNLMHEKIPILFDVEIVKKSVK